MEDIPELDWVLDEMDRIDWSSAPDSPICDHLADATNRPPPLPFLSEFPTQPQPVQSGDYDEFLSQGAAPYTMAAPTTYDEPTCEHNSTYTGSSYSQADAYNQGQKTLSITNGRRMQIIVGAARGDGDGPLMKQHSESVQYLTYQCPEEAPAAAVSRPAALPVICNDGAVMILPDVSAKSLHDVGGLNREKVFRPPPAVRPAFSAAPPQSNFSAVKQRKRRQHEENEAYIMKPPNAFMLFMKEQRPNVGPELRCKGSATVNAFLGQTWKSLSEQAQAKYYDEAERLRLLHKQQHPEWSNRENYGKRMTTRNRRKATRRGEAATLNDAPQARRMCVTEELQAPTLAPPAQRVMESQHLQATVEQLLNTSSPPDDSSASLLSGYSSWTDMLTSLDLFPQSQFTQPVGCL